MDSAPADRNDLVLVSLVGDASSAFTSPFENLRLGFIAAYLRRHNIRADILDEGLTVDGYTECLTAAVGCRTVVVDTMFRTMACVLAFVAEVRSINPEVRIVLVGDAARSTPVATLTAYHAVDAVVVADPEPTVLELHRTADWGAGVPGAVTRGGADDVLFLPRQDPVLDELPAPERPYLTRSLQHRPVVDVISSRGCPARCSFCMIGTSYRVPGLPTARGRWRGRPVQQVGREIADLVARYGVRRVHFTDDNALGPSRTAWVRARELAWHLKPLDISFSFYCRITDVDPVSFGDLADAGLSQVHVGMESGSSSVLRRLRKDQTPNEVTAALAILRHLGIRVVPSFIVFEERQTLGELIESLQWIKDVGNEAGFTRGGLVALPGTALMGQIAPAVAAAQRWNQVFTPVAPSDPGTAWLADAVARFEQELDWRTGEFTAVVTAYHRFTDRLDAAGAQACDARVLRHDELRRFEVEQTLAAARALQQDRDLLVSDPVEAWLEQWFARVDTVPTRYGADEP